MASRTSSANSSKSKRATNQKGKSSAAGGKGSARTPKKGQTSDTARIFDERTRQDIIGVIFAIFSIALFIAAIMPADGVITALVSSALHLTLGLGAYLLPFFLLAIGVSFLVRFERERVPARAALGLGIIFVALLALLALFTPVPTAHDLSLLFEHDQLAARGGYLGAGIAWAGLTLFGQIISCIILLGVILAGLVIIGFSLSKLIERVQEKRLREETQNEILDAPPFARVKRNSDNLSPVNPAHPLATAAATKVLPRSGRKSSRGLSQRSEAAASQRNWTPEQVTLAYDDQNVSETPQESPAPLTRRLGRKRSEKIDDTSKESGKAPKDVSSSKTQATSLPLATPRPQEGFALPSSALLHTSSSAAKEKASNAELKDTAARLQETLEDFGIMAEVVGWVAGPTVTLFKVDLPAGVRVSRIIALNDDIALALATSGVRIFAPIPGTNYVGIEVPNRTRQSVLLGDIVKDIKGGPLMIAIGKDVEGHSIVSDLAKMPHLLIGGTTGSGKSVSINGMIMSILMRATPAEVRLIMIDPKRVEFTPYNGIPHLYVPVVTEAREAASALSWGVAEMERRLKIFSKAGARNIGQYNAKVFSQELEDEGALQLPYIVIIIDELADLMMNVGKEVEFSISRIAQLARAAGIHLIVATQRPSTNVVTGLIKANITNRIALNVASSIDSRVILDTTGAEDLIGLGDLLLSKPELPKPQRIQGCYVSEDEINAVVSMLKEQGEPEYHSEILQTNLITLGASSPDGAGGGGSTDDPLIWEAADIVVSGGLGSTSNIQRRLKVGYSRAGRIMDMLEEKGIVGPPNGSKPREVLVDALELETLKAFENQDATQDASRMEE